MCLQMTVFFNCWAERFRSTSCVGVVSCSWLQMSDFLRVALEPELDFVRQANPFFWHKCHRSSKEAVFTSGKQMAPNCETGVVYFIGERFLKTAEKPTTGLEDSHFPNGKTASLPQPVKDSLRSCSFALPFCNKKYKIVNEEGEEVVANPFEKGYAFGEHVVSSVFLRL